MVKHSMESVLQAVRAVVAKELVLARGFSRARAARVLGVTAPAVSQYVSGKRAVLATQIEHDKKQMQWIQSVVDDVLREVSRRPEKVQAVLLKAAEKMTLVVPSSEKPAGASSSARSRWLSVLRKRLQEEHRAAQESMRFAQACEDELMTALFRQIASDSLRHAETVSTLINYLERPEPFDVRLPTKESVQKMIQQEEAADEAHIAPIKAYLDPAARLLIESIEADERKHVLLLKGLIRVIEEKQVRL